MADRTPDELRHLAARFREMSTEGDDEALKTALIELANEFEQEAERMEVLAFDQDPPDTQGS